MAELSSATVATGGLAFGAVTITGSLLGMHADSLAMGFLAALFALLVTRPDPDVPRTPIRVFGFVAGGAFAAGVLAPLVAAATMKYVAVAAGMDVDYMRLVSAAAIGAGVVLPALRNLVPAALERLRKLIGGTAS